MSNTERQRRFRQRHPGYYARRRALRNALMDSMAAQRVAVQVEAVRREPLMLPAPVEVIQIPGMNAIPAAGETAVRSPVPVPSAFASFFES